MNLLLISTLTKWTPGLTIYEWIGISLYLLWFVAAIYVTRRSSIVFKFRTWVIYNHIADYERLPTYSAMIFRYPFKKIDINRYQEWLDL